MTTLTSQTPDVLDYLVAQCQASQALQGVTVVDGPNVSGSLSGVEQVLWVGHDPRSVGEPDGEAEQAFALSMDQGRTRDETGTVTLTAKHWSGETESFKVHRDGCKAIVAVVELMLRGLPSNGGPGDYTMGGLVLWSHVTGPFQWYQDLIDGGGEALCVFRVGHRGRLTTS